MKKILGLALAAMLMMVASCLPAGWENLTQSDRDVWERCLNSIQATQCPTSPHVYQSGNMMPDVSQTVCMRRIAETFASVSTDPQRREYLQSVGCPPPIARR